ncbi:hypothetical protein ACTFIZ_011196 [Dictyostelium cf. discoideum]
MNYPRDSTHDILSNLTQPSTTNDDADAHVKNQLEKLNEMVVSKFIEFPLDIRDSLHTIKKSISYKSINDRDLEFSITKVEKYINISDDVQISNLLEDIVRSMRVR